MENLKNSLKIGILLSTLVFLSQATFAQDDRDVIYKPMNSNIEIDFNESGTDWKVIRGIGTADLIIGDSTDVRQAVEKAKLRAKAEISKFLTERISLETTSEEITKTVREASNSSSNETATRKIVDTTIEQIVSSSNAILRGVLPLSTDIQKENKLVRVEVGVSRKTIAISNSLNQSLKDNSSTMPSKENLEESESEIRRSKNYNDL